jgi:hypothetical protein
MHFFPAPVIGMRLFSAMRIDVNKVLLEIGRTIRPCKGLSADNGA